jgi:hypothetical protein
MGRNVIGQNVMQRDLGWGELPTGQVVRELVFSLLSSVNHRSNFMKIAILPNVLFIQCKDNRYLQMLKPTLSLIFPLFFHWKK